MRAPFMRIPYTGPLPPPVVLPASASTVGGAVEALHAFMSSAPQQGTLLLTGAGISVASGLSDYRGTAGTYTLNRSYRPIYHGEFVSSHRARQRYWARSFLGWTSLRRARPNAAHWAVKALGELGIVREVVTQNVDSFHALAHPGLRTTELHGSLAHLVCTTCRTQLPRADFQHALARLNPPWAAFLQDLLRRGALDSEDPREREKKGLTTNPDGDVHLPDAPWDTFRYPACPTCLAAAGRAAGGGAAGRAEAGLGHPGVEADSDGAWRPPRSLSSSSVAAPAAAGDSSGSVRLPGILKPGVVMFGESTDPAVKGAAEDAVDSAARVLVVGSSLATYSAWRLVRRAQERGIGVGVLNLGGVRGEDKFFDLGGSNAAPTESKEGVQQGEGSEESRAVSEAAVAGWDPRTQGVRVSLSAEEVLPRLVERFGGSIELPRRGEGDVEGVRRALKAMGRTE